MDSCSWDLHHDKLPCECTLKEILKFCKEVVASVHLQYIHVRKFRTHSNLLFMHFALVSKTVSPLPWTKQAITLEVLAPHCVVYVFSAWSWALGILLCYVNGNI